MEAKYNMIIELAQQQGLTHIQLTQKHCLHLAASVGNYVLESLIMRNRRLKRLREKFLHYSPSLTIKSSSMKT
ncbi:hypothetical protein [Mannheimia haemolytica]|uniref:Uncharacterized protein n=1 Tax=Mannheimia haemolytica TaxID=75985 RepID=A0A378MRG0_MANHA|nr:hypothetical protein [Mannheimia haemolytica]STY58695.1 Uncharacterised protein [Mannheimia haemolytica]